MNTQSFFRRAGDLAGALTLSLSLYALTVLGHGAGL
jgi:hypothetical protein